MTISAKRRRKNKSKHRALSIQPRSPWLNENQNNKLIKLKNRIPRLKQRIKKCFDRDKKAELKSELKWVESQIS